MTDSRNLTRSLRPSLALLPLVLLLGACTAGGEPVAEPDQSSASAPPSGAVSASPSPTALEFPAAVEGEVARAEFLEVGAGGVPESRSVAGDVTVGTYMVEGECVGTRVSYTVETAEAEPDRRELSSGTMSCDAPFGNTFPISQYEGGVQLSITDADLIETGWLRLVPATGS